MTTTKCLLCNKPADAIKASALPGGVEGRHGVSWCSECGAAINEGTINLDYRKPVSLWDVATKFTVAELRAMPAVAEAEAFGVAVGRSIVDALEPKRRTYTEITPYPRTMGMPGEFMTRVLPVPENCKGCGRKLGDDAQGPLCERCEERDAEARLGLA